ncbi:transporter [uncultured Pseudacidovorax sp.]|uniref:transporter n=1 Tax=uncultured Pseudacidovorax sp. TaxID=679313 RepID=UPI0025FFF038|nr:transporter [uncultured Pseudacidovorax sp.]
MMKKTQNLLAALPLRSLPWRRASLAALTLQLCGLSAQAMQPLITDDTGTQGVGVQQIEMAAARARQSTGPARQTGDSLSATYTYGLTDTVDVYAAPAFLRMQADGSRTSGWGNTALGLKWRFYENEATGTSLGLKPEFAAPVSSRREARGLGDGRSSGQVTLLLSQQLPFGALHVNYAWGRQRDIDPMAGAINRRLSTALVWNIADDWKLAADLGLQQRQRRDATRQRTRYAEVGVVYSLSPRWDLAAGLIRARDDQQPTGRTTTGTLGLTGHF